jgi:hypothetical protein
MRELSKQEMTMVSGGLLDEGIDAGSGGAIYASDGGTGGWYDAATSAVKQFIYPTTTPINTGTPTIGTRG